MLAECIDEILKQKIPVTWSVELIVINNDPSDDISEIINARRANTSLEISLKNEYALGIPFARNTACKTALERGAEWIIFIDDDEFPNPGWLEAYAKATEEWDAKAFTGPVNYIMPSGCAEWLENKGLRFRKNGSKCSRAGTCNVMFSKDLLLPPFSLSFDTEMQFTGGSDSDFFMRFVHAGGVILAISEAIVSEHVPPNRLTIQWRLKRQYRSSANRVYIKFKLHGAKKTIKDAAREIIMRMLHGTVKLVISPLSLIYGYTCFKRTYYHALRHFSKAFGTIAGLFGNQPQPYRHVDGY